MLGGPERVDSVEKLWAACVTRLKYGNEGAYRDVELLFAEQTPKQGTLRAILRPRI